MKLKKFSGESMEDLLIIALKAYVGHYNAYFRFILDMASGLAVTHLYPAEEDANSKPYKSLASPTTGKNSVKQVTLLFHAEEKKKGWRYTPLSNVHCEEKFP